MVQSGPRQDPARARQGLQNIFDQSATSNDDEPSRNEDEEVVTRSPGKSREDRIHDDVCIAQDRAKRSELHAQVGQPSYMEPRKSKSDVSMYRSTSWRKSS